MEDKTLLLLFVVFVVLLFVVVSLRANAVDMTIISYLESRHTVDAYNPDDGERGLFQISPICLEAWNKYNDPDYQPQHLYNAGVNRQIALWYMNERIPEMLRAYDIPVTEKNKLWAYNAGISRVKRGVMPKTTKRYIEKYFELKGGG